MNQCKEHDWEYVWSENWHDPELDEIVWNDVLQCKHCGAEEYVLVEVEENES